MFGLFLGALEIKSFSKKVKIMEIGNFEDKIRI